MLLPILILLVEALIHQEVDLIHLEEDLIHQGVEAPIHPVVAPIPLAVDQYLIPQAVHRHHILLVE